MYVKSKYTELTKRSIVLNILQIEIFSGFLHFIYPVLKNLKKIYNQG